MRNLVAKLRAGRKVQVALGLVLIAVGVTACGSSDSSSSAADGGSSKKHVTVAFYQVATNIPTYVQAGWGAKQAGTADGSAKVVTGGPSNPTPTNSATAALSLAQSAQPDAYVFDAVFPSMNSLFPKLGKLAKGNVFNVLNAATSAAGQTPPKGAETFVGPNFANLGYVGVEAAVKGAKLSPSTTGTALVGNCSVNPTNTLQIAGATAALKKLLPKLKVVNFNTAVPPAANTAAWVSQIAKTSDLAFVVPVCTQDTASIVTLKNRGTGGDFVATAYWPTSKQEFQAIADGKIAGGVTANFWLGAYIGTRMAINAARGTDAPEGWIDCGLVTVTKDNALKVGAASSSSAAAAKEYQAAGDEVLGNLGGQVKPMDDVFKLTL